MNIQGEYSHYYVPLPIYVYGEYLNLGTTDRLSQERMLQKYCKHHDDPDRWIFLLATSCEN